jgi:hypothetical protein
MGANDFFLEPDDSKSLGDINFMRKSVRVRRTFPKTIKNPNGFEMVKETSSVEQKSFDEFNGNGSSINTFNGNGNSTINAIKGNGAYATNGNGFAASNSEAQAPAPTTPETSAERKQADNSLDMFRNMARQMRR